MKPSEHKAGVPQAAIQGQGSDEHAVQVGSVSMNVVESYVFAASRRDLNIYSERLLLALVKTAQKQLQDVNLADPVNRRQLSIGALGDVEVEISAKELLSGDTDSNYTNAKAAVRELMNKKIEQERPMIRKGSPVLSEEGRQLYEYEAHAILNDVYINVKPGTIIVNVNKKTWEGLLDMGRGFKSYDIYIAQRLSRVPSIRLYKLICNQKTPLRYTIDELRHLWKLEDKYQTTAQFLRNTLDSAQEELNKKSPWTFEYDKVYAQSSEANTGRRGRKAITSVIIKPIHRIAFESDTHAVATLSPSIALTRAVTDRLIKGLKFSNAEIKANLVLLAKAARNFDLEAFLIKITPLALRAANTQGYVVNSVKKHLKEHYGIVIKKDRIVQTPAAASVKSGAPHKAHATGGAGKKEKTVGDTLGTLFGKGF